MENFIYLLALLIALELFESSWQKADSIYRVLEINYQVYKKNIFLYFLMNPSFFFILSVMIAFNNFGFWMTSIILMKFGEIALRLHILNKMDLGEDIRNLIPIDVPMTNALRYMNVMIYIPAFIFAFFT
jgi:hypothetical protein